MEKKFTKEKLHITQLEELYGPIKVNVLRHDKLMREVHLEDKNGISRTYALTFFSENNDLEFQEINKEIQLGSLIGRTFEKHGYFIRKRGLGFFIVDLPVWLRDKFNTKGAAAKANVYEFCVSKAESVFKVYGTIVEIYPPEFKPPVILESENVGVNNRQLLGIENLVRKIISKTEIK